MKNLLSTQIAYHLALATTVRHNGHELHFVLPLVRLTTLISWFWIIVLALDQVKIELSLILADILTIMEITTKTVIIAVNVFAYALGVSP